MENQVTVTAGSLINDASSATEGLLSIATKIFNWAITNPLFLLGLLIAIIFVGVGLVKKFAH